MLVAAQFMSLALSVYMNASNASFYRALSHPDGMGELYTTMRRVCAIDGVSVYALTKRALVAYLVRWVQQHPDMADDVLRES